MFKGKNWISCLLNICFLDFRFAYTHWNNIIISFNKNMKYWAVEMAKWFKRLATHIFVLKIYVKLDQSHITVIWIVWILLQWAERQGQENLQNFMSKLARIARIYDRGGIADVLRCGIDDYNFIITDQPPEIVFGDWALPNSEYNIYNNLPDRENKEVLNDAIHRVDMKFIQYFHCYCNCIHLFHLVDS